MYEYFIRRLGNSVLPFRVSIGIQVVDFEMKLHNLLSSPLHYFKFSLNHFLMLFTLEIVHASDGLQSIYVSAIPHRIREG